MEGVLVAKRDILIGLLLYTCYLNEPLMQNSLRQRNIPFPISPPCIPGVLSIAIKSEQLLDFVDG